MKFTFPYGREQLSISLPEQCTYFIPQQPLLKAPAPAIEIAKGVKKLCRFISSSLHSIETTSFLLIIDDITRPTPTSEILTLLLPAFERMGIPAKNVCILIALGTHRPMIPVEINRKVGSSVGESVLVLQHDCYNDALLTEFGQSRFGYPLKFNSLLSRSNTVRIAIGSVSPHPDVGWSGGSKLIYPGLAGYATIAGLHKEAGRAEKALLGDMSSHLRKEIDDAVEDSNILDYILNTVLFADQSLYKLVVGEPGEAQKIAMELSQKVHCVTFPKVADIAIASSHPYDTDFWQATKALVTASQAVRAGGAVLLLAACPEGIGPHPELTSYLTLPLDRLKQLVTESVLEGAISVGVALQIKRIQQRVNVAIVSPNIDKVAAEMMGFQIFPNAQTALREWLPLKTSQSVSLIPNAGATIPIIEA